MQTVTITEEQAAQIRRWVRVARSEAKKAYKRGDLEALHNWNERDMGINDVLYLLGINIYE